SVSIVDYAGNINLPSNHIPVWTDSNGNGGGIGFYSNGVTFPQMQSQPLIVDGSGTGGYGGSFSYITTNRTPLAAGFGAGNFQVTSNGTSVGNFTISTGGNLTVDASAIQMQASGGGGGGSLELAAGSNGPGKLLVNGNLHVDGSDVYLFSNSRT